MIRRQKNGRLERNSLGESCYCVVLHFLCKQLKCISVHWLQLIRCCWFMKRNCYLQGCEYSQKSMYYPYFKGSYGNTEELIWNQFAWTRSCRVSNDFCRHRWCHYTSCAVEGFIQKLDKLYAKPHISFVTLIVTFVSPGLVCWNVHRLTAHSARDLPVFLYEYCSHFLNDSECYRGACFSSL